MLDGSIVVQEEAESLRSLRSPREFRCTQRRPFTQEMKSNKITDQEVEKLCPHSIV